jgi:putative DNA primase/helicase
MPGVRTFDDDEFENGENDETQTEQEAQDKRSETSAKNGKNGGRKPAPEHAKTAERFMKARLMRDGYLVVRHWRGEWFRYAENIGWTQTPDMEIQEILATYLRSERDLKPYTTTHYCSSVMLNLRAHDLCGLPGSVEMPCFLSTKESARNWIAFSNGKLANIYEYALSIAENRNPVDYIKAVTPDFFSLDFVKYAWSPEQQTPIFNRYINRVQPNDSEREAVRRMLGLCMTDITRYEVFFQLYGFGSNGKTVLLDVATGLVGKGLVSCVSLDGLIARFQSFPLATSKINICGELPTDTGRGQFHAIEGALKDCVSGGLIEVEKKGQDKYTAPCRARFLMSTNSLPTFFDKSDGIWRRLRIIPFHQQIEDAEKDVCLAEKIVATELPGIAAWALKGLAQILRDGVFAECERGQEMKNRHRQDCDHEMQFLTEYYEKGKDYDRMNAKVLHNHYREWMDSNGYKSLGASKFYARVEQVFPGLTLKTVRINGDPTKGFDMLRRIA